MDRIIEKGKHRRLQVRMGVLPTKVERDRTKYCRKDKHKNRLPASHNPREGIGLHFEERKPIIFSLSSFLLGV